METKKSITSIAEARVRKVADRLTLRDLVGEFALFVLLSFVTGLLITLLFSLAFGRGELLPLDMVIADGVIALGVGALSTHQRYRRGVR